MADYLHLFWFALILYILHIFLLKIVVHLWWAPRRVENHFMKQGIKGPKYQLFLGNLKELSTLNLRASAQSMPLSHNILPRVLSFYHHWKKIYGMLIYLFLQKRNNLTFPYIWLITCLQYCYNKAKNLYSYTTPFQIFTHTKLVWAVRIIVCVL